MEWRGSRGGLRSFTPILDKIRDRAARGNAADAATWYQRAADIDPNWGKPLLKLGLAAAERGVARGADVALADLAAVGLVGVEQLRSAPALQRAGQFPAEVDGVTDAGVHAETAGRDDEMHRITRKQHAPLAVAVGDEAARRPFVRAQDLVGHIDAGRFADHRHRIPLPVSDRR